MIKLLIKTFVTKVVTAAVTLGIVMLTTHVLGPEGRGEISLITADIGIILLFIQIVGGSSLVYLVPRSNTFHLLICSFIWTVFLPFMIVPLLNQIGIVKYDYNIYLIAVCIIQGLSSTCQIMLLGHERIATYNLLLSGQTLVHFACLCFLFFVQEKRNTESFLWSLLLCHSFIMIMGFALIFPLIHNKSLFNFWSTAKQALVRGFTVQFSNLVQFLNYRLSMFFLSSQLSNLGLFSISLVLAEAIWLLGNSVGVVQYSKISNEKNRDKSIKMSFSMAKISFWATLICVLILALLPEAVYGMVFGSGFREARYPTLILCPGILAIGTAVAFSHHFAGIGKFNINNKAALLGLAVNIPCCVLLVPVYKELGAAAACSLSYIASCVFLFMCFKKETKFRLTDFYPTKSDINNIALWSRTLFRNSPV